MSFADRNEIVDFLDDEGHIEGIQMPSVKRKIQEWREKKEDEAFDALCKQLGERNYKQAWRDANRQKCRSAEQKWWASRTEQQRQRIRDRRKAWRDKKRQEVVNTCEECGKSFSLTGRTKRARFCSRKCNKRNWNKRNPG